MRVEQLYPFPSDALAERIERMPALRTVVWAQEEPKNAGAWTFVAPFVEELLESVSAGPKRPIYAGRPAAAATAAGLLRDHNKQQAALIAAALGHDPE